MLVKLSLGTGTPAKDKGCATIKVAERTSRLVYASLSKDLIGQLLRGFATSGSEREFWGLFT